MPVVVKLSGEAAEALHGKGAPSEQSRTLLELADALGVVLQPQHADTTDPELLGFFEVDTEDFEAAQKMIEHLLRCKGVEGAYFKPPEALP